MKDPHERKIVLTKWELDKAFKDKRHIKFPSTMRVEVRLAQHRLEC